MYLKPLQNPWDILERIPGLKALPNIWQTLLGANFSAFHTLCLHESTKLVDEIPCPNDCGCTHTVILRHDRTSAIAICRCDPPKCPDTPLTLAQITPLQVNRPRLARALAKEIGRA